MPNGRFVLAVVPLVLMACGEAGGGGGGPTTPTPPIAASASIAAVGSPSVDLCDPPGFDCSYSQDYANSGNGCANNVRGRVAAWDEDSLLETDEWWLEPTAVVRPDEIFTVGDCCFRLDSTRSATRFVSEAFWNNVSCK
jgi:hypothetical protein